MMIRTPVPIVMPSVMMALMHPLMTTVVSTMVQTLLLKMDTGAGMLTLRLGASLRDRATLPSPLRGLGPSGGYPSRLRSLRSLRAPLARRLAPLPAVAGPTRSALRSTESSGQPSGPPRDGAARRARRGSTPCVAGVGFAVHRTPRRVVHRCPHKCGHRRARFRRRAAHDPVQHPLHSRPLKRRGGSDEPLSPAPISRTLMLHDLAVPTAGAALVLTPDASLMQRSPWLPMVAIGWLCPGHWCACRRLACRIYLPPIGARKRPPPARSRRLHRPHAAPSTFRNSAVLRQVLLRFPASTYKC